MKIDITKLKIHNFMSYADEEFDFSEHNGLNLICGKNNDIPGSKNGSGKSSLLNALAFSIFGKLPFSLSNENVRNRYVEDVNMQTILDIASNNKKYRIVSGIKRKNGYCKLYETDENGNERDITCSGVTETRAYIINEIFHCDLELFMRIIYLNSDQKYNFYNYTPDEKRKFLDKIFDLMVFNNAYKSLNTDINRINKDINCIQSALLVLNSSKSDYEKRIKTFSDDNSNKIKKLEVEYEKIRKELDSKIKELNKYSKNTIEKCQNTLDDYVKRLTENDRKINDIRRNISQYDIDIKNHNQSIKANKDFISKNTKIKNVICDECNKKVNSFYNIDAYNSKIDELNEKINELNKKKDIDNGKIKGLLDYRNEMIEKQGKLKKKLNNVLNETDTLNFEIRQLTGKEVSLKNEIENLKNSKNPYIDLINNTNKEIESKIKDIEKNEYIIKHYTYAQSIISPENLKRIIVKDMVQILNMEINNYLKRMGASFSVEFDNEMSCRFITKDNVDAEFHNFSSGEQARISIATCFAFRKFLAMRSNIMTNILIIDEFIDGNIDSYAIDNVIEILREISDINQQNVYVVSHRKELSPEIFDNIIQIEKTNNISKINYISK